MSNAGIKYDDNGLNNWRNWIERMGEVLNKGNMQKRRKFYDGLPESFESVVGFESSRPDASSFLIDSTSPPFSPSLTLTRSVALSSAESEMFGLCLSLKEGLFYRDLLFDLGVIVFGSGPTIVHLDSQGQNKQVDCVSAESKSKINQDQVDRDVRNQVTSRGRRPTLPPKIE